MTAIIEDAVVRPPLHVPTAVVPIPANPETALLKASATMLKQPPAAQHIRAILSRPWRQPVITTGNTYSREEVEALLPFAGEKRTIKARLTAMYVGAYNTRIRIIEAEVIDMAETMKVQGILQKPLGRWVEVSEDVFMLELAYGQKRFLAANLAFGEDAEIEVEVRAMTDAEAVAASTIENINRSDMSPAEEAAAAAQMLGITNGDRDECARRLGWKRWMLDDRLKLMACSERVRERLTYEKLPLGIAELMAGLTHAKQDELLASFDQAGSVPTIEGFKTRVQAFTKAITAAIFPQDDCASCPHNSAQQRSMFATRFDEDHCLNSSCYDNKTEAELERRAANLRETYAVVKIFRPGEQHTVRKLMAANHPTLGAGVGVEQAQACRSCANFGAAVSAHPEKLGRVSDSICYDVACHGEKVEAQKAAQHQAAKLAEPPAEEPPAQQRKKAAASGKTKTTKVNAKPGKADTKTAAKVTVTLTTAVKEYRDALYRTIIAREVNKAPQRGYAMLIALAARMRLSCVDSGKVEELLSKKAQASTSSYSLADSYTAALTVPDETLSRIVAWMATTAPATLTSVELVSMVKALEPNWAEHFVLGGDFLEKLTKTEIEAVAVEVGLDKAMGDSHKGLYAKKKAEIIAALTKVDGFTYSGAIPRVLKPGVGN